MYSKGTSVDEEFLSQQLDAEDLEMAPAQNQANKGRPASKTCFWSSYDEWILKLLKTHGNDFSKAAWKE